ncbi:MAG: polysaccharide deacetylase family protein [Anaerolineales bacterium]
MQTFTLTVVMYHYVRDPGDRCEGGSGIAGLPVAQFEAQLEMLTRRHELIAWPDLRAFLMEQKPLPPSPCLLTFDDGLLDHYFNIFPILRARGLSGLFFAMARHGDEGLTLAHKIHFLLPVLTLNGLREAIWKSLNPTQRDRFVQAERRYQLRFNALSPDGPTNVLKSILQREFSPEIEPLLSKLFEHHVGAEVETARDYYLSHAQMEEMTAGGMHFGGHSRSHPWFDWVSAETQANEIAASASWLRGVEAGPWAFAYPYGGLSADAAEILKAQGFAAGFTTREQTTHAEPYFIGRLDGDALTVTSKVIEAGHGQRYA